MTEPTTDDRPLPEFTSDVPVFPSLRGPKYRIDEVEALEVGTVLVDGANYLSAFPVEYLGIVRVEQNARTASWKPITKQIRKVKVRWLDGRRAGSVGRMDARDLRGRWEEFVDRCRAEQALREPTEHAAAVLEVALSEANLPVRVDAVLVHPGGDHSNDHVQVKLTPDEALRLAGYLKVHSTDRYLTAGQEDA
jgi:hypothetical protein